MSTGIDGYMEFLVERDGEADALNRRLSHREKYFADIENNPVRSTRRINQDVFNANLKRRPAGTGPEPRDALPAGHREAQSHPNASV